MRVDEAAWPEWDIYDDGDEEREGVEPVKEPFVCRN